MQAADVIIIGAGIAGASVGSWLAPHARVVLIEREAQPGYHSTGRSVAVFSESYGTAQVRALTMASRAFLEAPPAGFAEHPLLSPRGALFVASHDQKDLLDRHEEILRSFSEHTRRFDTDGARAVVPVLRREAVLGAVLEADAADMDVNALHQGFLRGLRRAGGKIVCNAEMTALEHVGDVWEISAG